jgi:hypothetical protein
MTGSRSLLGRTGDLNARPLVLLPIENVLSEDETEIIERNTGVAFLDVHYPHYIMDSQIGGVIDITDGPVNPIPEDVK